ncbi:YkyB family protein [Kurthia huakuii]|uniref:YkyB family protein n=1 Tax=Kurthia huakuii TaxID=1421019 RepID=UPI000495CEBD|nr:YkyB family protein [Kurthia huakuii]MBM7698481.1 hypothetical protein [Kurthia huakuii]
MTYQFSNNELALAVFTVNKHAKTALDNKGLYALKRSAICELLRTNRAKKIGLHFVNNPRFSKQQSAVLIQCEDYYFHTLPQKEDFAQLPHLGHLDRHYRNPKRRMSLNEAKRILCSFTNTSVKPIRSRPQNDIRKASSSYFYGY